ncbi:mitochondrial ribosomal protein S16 [Arctopsyche grandis]|uniref:mitochondrial ribosomal protein S16 n=1 Tax=Arctopsyche grandis TaxID=121162 RepID=UPI00406D9417
MASSAPRKVSSYIGCSRIIRLIRHGCANRPFYQIVLQYKTRYRYLPGIEQLGAYDPMPNQYNEKLVSLNFDRLKHHIGAGALVTRPVSEVFGLAGYFPIHPRTYMKAWRQRLADKNVAEETPEVEKA